MGTATNRPRASSSPYFAIHSTIIHFTQYKKTFSRQYKSYTVFCGHNTDKFVENIALFAFRVRFTRTEFVRKATYDDIFRALFVTDARCAEVFGKDKSGTPESGINKPSNVT